jgi:hypothetical protein
VGSPASAHRTPLETVYIDAHPYLVLRWVTDRTFATTCLLVITDYEEEGTIRDWWPLEVFTPKPHQAKPTPRPWARVRGICSAIWQG